MPSTSTLWATTQTNAGGGGATWANTSNVFGANDGLTADLVSIATGATGFWIQLSGYGAQAAIGSQPASVDSVVVVAWHDVSSASRFTNGQIQLYDGTTPLGTSQALTESGVTTWSESHTFTGVATWANLASLGVRLTNDRTGASTANWHVDAASVVVNYTAASPAPAGRWQSWPAVRRAAYW